MLIALIVIISLSLLILAHEAGHFVTAKWFKLKVDEFGFGFPPRIFAKKKGETAYSLNWLPFGGFVKIAGENDMLTKREELEQLPAEDKEHLFSFQPMGRRTVIILAGVAVNFLIGWFLLATVFMVGVPQAVVITGIQPGSPAEVVGLMRGDIIREFSVADEFVAFVNEHRGEKITVKVQRGNKALTIDTTLRAKAESNEGALGVLLTETGTPRHGFFGAISESFTQSLRIAGLTVIGFLQLIAQLVTRGSLAEGVVGPVGIFSIAQQTGELGLIHLVQLISVISLSLAVINILPFPPLDGGKFFLLILEKIKGARLSQRAEVWVNSAGFILLIALLFIITLRDIARWF